MSKTGKPNRLEAVRLQLPNNWKERFVGYSLRQTFMLALTKPMMEFLCAVSDDVSWDRAAFPGIHAPDNWVATAASLEKRGLIERHTEEECKRKSAKWIANCLTESVYEHSYWKLTPAGSAVVHLLKTVGLFHQADAAISKKAKVKRG